MGEFKTPFSPIDRSSKTLPKKINTEKPEVITL
jgi:hypothetical protein